MLEAERIHAFVLQLPGDQRASTAVPHDYPRDEALRSRVQVRVVLGPDHGSFTQGFWELVPWHIELRVTEVLDRSHRDHHLLSSSLRCVKLPIELTGVEFAWGGFDTVPIGCQTDDFERMGEQGRKCGGAVEAEGLDLSRPEADSQ